MSDSVTNESASTEYRAFIEFAPDGELDSLPYRVTIYADGVRVDRLWTSNAMDAHTRAKEWVEARRARVANPVTYEPHWVTL